MTSSNSRASRPQVPADLVSNNHSAVRAISIALERRCFKFDRGAMVGELKNLRSAVREGALELEMAADEKTFSPTISDRLKDNARLLQKIASDLGQLQGDIAHTTGYPRNGKK